MSDSGETKKILWEGILALANGITRRQPGSYEYERDGSGWWTTSYGSSRSPAEFVDDQRGIITAASVYSVGQADGGQKSYRLVTIIEEQSSAMEG